MSNRPLDYRDEKTHKELIDLEQGIQSHIGDFDKITQLFTQSYNRSLLSRYLSNSIVEADHKRIAKELKGLSRRHILLINSERLEYSAWVWTNDAAQSSSIVWAGEQRIIGLRGRGSVRIRRHQLLGCSHVNDFSTQAKLKYVDTHVLTDGQLCINSNPLEVLEITDFTPPVVLEVLTIKSMGALYSWDFSEVDGSLNFIRMASLQNSRIRSMLEICFAMKSSVPNEVYDEIFDHGDPQLKIYAIQIMLNTKHPHTFDRLNQAITDDDELVSSSAQQLLDKLLNAGAEAQSTISNAH